MANLPSFENHLRDQRIQIGWSQEELARRSGLSRAGISAVETGRIIPSAAAAPALAASLQCRVEDLFNLRRPESREPGWAWQPAHDHCRYWVAEVGGAERFYPVAATPMGVVPHDGIYRNVSCQGERRSDPRRTLVMACCDPAVCLRLFSEEAGLDFLDVRQEAYDLCFPACWEGDIGIQALLNVVRSPSYRKALGELPGYDSVETGDLKHVP